MSLRRTVGRLPSRCPPPRCTDGAPPAALLRCPQERHPRPGGTGTVMWEMLHRHVADPDVVVQAMSARTVKVMVARGAGLGLLAGFETSADINGLVWLPLRDADPVHLCLTQRQDGLPSPSALIVRRLIRARADELTE
ncbi:LysR substrate-binding domain-containing protein [Streptomyces marispadix]|uniref:Substrate-binding domain-containing protein n=1 Tax=Streptomyces marispadix TaxID=2922868 RepID=A0ABS9T5G7_9ACTN|nr:LysR substrate-binding domain-containing protein [Streptomyces marispadix]MCH6163799.1 substrate-binding domain-containing protein [Streptomyces marispadix]